MSTNDAKPINYKIVICGGIGAGKTTLVKKLGEYFKNNQKTSDIYGIIPEYIDGMKDGQEMLNKWIKGQISLEEFQDYINESSCKLNEKVLNKSIKIYDRTPFESAEIFAKDTTSYEKTLNNALKIHNKFNIPFIPISQHRWKVINAQKKESEVYKDVLDIIEDDIKHNVEFRIIYLKINIRTCIYRVKYARKRESESTYSDEYLAEIIYRYDELFDCIYSPFLLNDL